jgi:hypothetical protein
VNRVKAWIKTVLVGYSRDLNGQQLAGEACALCGQPFFDPEHRADYGWTGLPLRRRAYACEGGCIITVVADVETLFRSAIPDRQDVLFWYLGVDDVPLLTGEDGVDTLDEAYTARIAAQPTVRVRIAHPGGVVTTRPLPQDYAQCVAMQAWRLGFSTQTVTTAAEVAA